METEANAGESLRIGLVNNIAEINGQKFQKVVVHIGDSTAYAAIHSLQEPHTAVIIVDPIARAAAGLVEELQKDPEHLGEALGREDILRNTLLSFHNATQSPDGSRIRANYAKLWERASANFANLFIVETGIDEIEFPDGFTDEVSYHYPFREDTLKTAFIFAMHALKAGGKFTVATEMSIEEPGDLYDRHNFVDQLRILVEETGDQFEDKQITRTVGIGPYFSGYDMAFEARNLNPHLITITREEGPAPQWEDETIREVHKQLRIARIQAGEL